MAGSAAAATQAAAREQLRALVGLPKVSFQLGLEFNQRHGWVFAGDSLRADEELARLRAELETSAGSPQQQLHIAELTESTGDAAEARKALEWAIRRFETMNAADSTEDALVAGYAEALRLAGRIPEAISVLRRFLASTPTGWRSRVELGLNLVYEAGRRLAPEAEGQAGGAGRPLAIEPSSAQVDGMRRLLDRAIAEGERAVELATQEPDAYLGRARIRTAGKVLEALLGAEDPQGKARAVSQAMFSPEVLPDLATAARLAPDDPRLNGIWIWSALLADTIARGGPASGGIPGGVEWGTLPDSLRQAVRQVLARMDQVTLGDDPVRSSRALELAGSLQFIVIGDHPGAERGLRQAVRLDPANEPAWEVLCASLATAGRFEALLEVAQERLETADNPRNRFILAKAYDRLDRRREARMELQRAWMKWPKEPLPALGLCALVLRDDFENAGLGVVARLLGTAQENLGAKPPRELVLSLLPIRAVFFTLAGQFDPAQQAFEQWLALTPEDPAAAKEGLRLLDRIRREAP